MIGTHTPPHKTPSHHQWGSRRTSGHHRSHETTEEKEMTGRGERVGEWVRVGGCEGRWVGGWVRVGG